MNVYVPNPAVEFDWPDPATSDAPLVARVHGDPPGTVPVEEPGVVETMAYALDGRSRDELAAHLAGTTGLDRAAARDRITALIDGRVLVRDGPTRRREREWLRHGWRRSMYYHLATRDWSPGVRDAAPLAASPPDDGETVALPDPGRLPNRPLDEVMLARRTCRSFDGTPMAARDLSTLLAAGLGPVRSARDGDGEALASVLGIERLAEPLLGYATVGRATEEG